MTQLDEKAIIIEKGKEIVGLPPFALENAKYICFKKGEYLCKEDEKMKYILFLVSGKAKVSITAANGRSLLLSFFHKGQIVGDVEMMLHENISTANVIAITQIECIGLSVDYCKKVLSTNIDFMNFIAQRLAQKLDYSAKSSAMNILYTLENRLCAYIVSTHENGEFQENLTELAELLGTSYRHLLRTMQELCEEGIIERCSRTKYKIIDLISLKERAEDCF